MLKQFWRYNKNENVITKNVELSNMRIGIYNKNKIKYNTYINIW